MTREEKEQTGKYVLQMARLLEDGCYQQEMLLKAVHIIDEVLEQEPTAKNNLGVDLISRNEILNRLASIAKVKAKSDAQKSLMGRCMFMVEHMPLVTPQEPRWITVSERLPEEDTDVLVTLKCGLIGIMQKKLADDDNGEPCYTWQDFEGEEHEVIAWMPLSQPYREVKE